MGKAAVFKDVTACHPPFATRRRRQIEICKSETAGQLCCPAVFVSRGRFQTISNPVQEGTLHIG